MSDNVEASYYTEVRYYDTNIDIDMMQVLKRMTGDREY